MKKTNQITTINTTDTTNTTNTNNTKGEITMKNTRTKKHSFKTRLIATALSAITILSVGAMSFSTASVTASAASIEETGKKIGIDATDAAFDTIADLFPGGKILLSPFQSLFHSGVDDKDPMEIIDEKLDQIDNKLDKLDEKLTVLIEVPPEKVRTVRKEERRKQYVSDCMKNKEFTILHLGDMDSDDGITGEELIASLDESVDTLAIRNLDISTLRKALKTLNEKEYEVIASLHYASPPLTEAQLADRLGVHQSTISRRKNAAYRKIRKFFEKN